MFDEVLAARMEALHPELKPRKMFGGLGFFLDGNMCLGVYEDRMMVRLGEGTAAAIGDGVEPFSPGGKTMGGWAVVDQELLAEEEQLDAWMMRGIALAAQLPPK